MCLCPVSRGKSYSRSLIERRFPKSTAIAIKRGRGGSPARGRCLSPACPKHRAGMPGTKQTARLIDNSLPFPINSLSWRALQSAGDRPLPCNLSDGIDLRPRGAGGEGTPRDVDYDVRQTFLPRYFIQRRLTDVRCLGYLAVNCENPSRARPHEKCVNVRVVPPRRPPFFTSFVFLMKF